jgi:hypothetical protein
MDENKLIIELREELKKANYAKDEALRWYEELVKDYLLGGK